MRLRTILIGIHVLLTVSSGTAIADGVSVAVKPQYGWVVQQTEMTHRSYDVPGQNQINSQYGAEVDVAYRLGNNSIGIYGAMRRLNYACDWRWGRDVRNFGTAISDDYQQKDCVGSNYSGGIAYNRYFPISNDLDIYLSVSGGVQRRDNDMYLVNTIPDRVDWQWRVKTTITPAYHRFFGQEAAVSAGMNWYRGERYSVGPFFEYIYAYDAKLHENSAKGRFVADTQFGGINRHWVNAGVRLLFQ